MQIFQRLKQLATACLMLALIACDLQQEASLASLSAVIDGAHRTAENSARDKYRHPQQTLEFLGITPDMTVVEIWPGSGWYTEILAPWIKQGGGQFIAAGFPPNAQPEFRQKIQVRYEALLATQPSEYDAVTLAAIGSEVMCVVAPADSVDAVLTFRNAHNWVKDAHAEDMFNQFFSVLKSGGILGVVDHRALPGATMETMMQSGYLTQALVISLAEKAGFVLDATSEINANPLDDTVHPKGVWSLPPMLRLGNQDRVDYLAIGESDRMTLRFKKP